ncbi:Guanine nucleotide exchange factor for Cdc42p [Spiromyces aspiralis]|uniref:Guanine nucleotide exchange factor for Cdc42p n=1 Tax=Spiromyces aspiralis TaxID=68401 RepID=A0ACC1HSW6_9FUNG|nr:Guanine nucleotide exchange factor for Cdc42p [Spiromyces aspiralis]
MERALNYTTAQDQQTSVTGSALTRHKSESEAHFYKNGGASNTSTVIHDRRPSTPNFSYSMISKSAPSAPVPPLTYDTGTLHRDSSRALQLNGFLLSPAQPAPPHTAGLLEDSSYFPSTDSAVATMAVATVTSTTTASSVVAPPAVMTPQPLGLLSSIGNDNGPRSAPPSDSSFPQTTPPPLPSKSGTTRDVAKIKVHFQNDTYMLLLSLNSTYREIVEKVEKKIKICAGPRVGVISSKEEDIESSPPLDILLKYIDEDGDMITIRSDEDVQLAFVSALDARADSNAIPILNLYPTL